MSFHVGQKVECINDTLQPGEPGPYVRKGAVYTIASIEPGYYSGEPTLCLEELPSPAVETDDGMTWDQGYMPEHFRPIVERKTDTGFAVLEEIRRRESVPDRIPALTPDPQP